MKDRYNIVLVLLITMIIGSCNDFLDVKPKGKDVPEKIRHYDGLFNNTILTNLTFSEVNSDGSTTSHASELFFFYMSDELTTDSNYFQNMERSAQMAYTFSPDIFLRSDYSAEWSTAYQQIYLYNVIIGGVMDADDGTLEKKKELLAEARVGRAYMHYYLAQFFCKPYHWSTAAQDAGIPVVKKANTNENNFPRGSVQEVYDFVVRELEEACPQLPQKTQHRQRVYQAAGYYMLGRVYLTMGEYTKALTALKMAFEATQNSSVTLALYDYNQEMANWGYMGSPAMWGMMNSYPTNLGDNYELIYNKQYSVFIPVFSLFPPMVFVKPEYMELYSPNDLRKNFFSNTDGATSNWPFYKRICRMMYSLGGELPDLYLMLAECKARTGDEIGAREDLLTLRKNRIAGEEAAIPDEVNTKEALIHFIIDERKREYMMTGMRWFDVRRLWNDPLFQADRENYSHAVGSQKYKLTEERLTYRIPPMVLDFNTGWKNND